jgi:hypothetical protein
MTIKSMFKELFAVLSIFFGLAWYLVSGIF